jgi:2-dehydrotetronate isomerase
MPRFSANLGFLWPDRPLLQKIEAAAKAGFKAVELHFPYDTPAEDVRAACANLGVKLLGINTALGEGAGFHRGLGAVPGREAEFRALFDQSLAWCVAAGGTAIHVMAGLVPERDRPLGREVFVGNLRYAAPKAEAAGIRILLEPLNFRDMPGYFYSTAEEAGVIVERLGAPNVTLMFDVYHVGCTEGDVIMRMRKLFHHIGHIQIAAVPGRAEPDEGEIAYPAIFDEIDRLGYQGWVGCEYKPRGDTDAGLTWPKTLGVTL